jgi:hypothetical protein
VRGFHRKRIAKAGSSQESKGENQKRRALGPPLSYPSPSEIGCPGRARLYPGYRSYFFFDFLAFFAFFAFFAFLAIASSFELMD